MVLLPGVPLKGKFIANRDCIIVELQMDDEIYIEMPSFNRPLTNKTV
jgi:hypothetical protein